MTLKESLFDELERGCRWRNTESERCYTDNSSITATPTERYSSAWCDLPLSVIPLSKLSLSQLIAKLVRPLRRHTTRTIRSGAVSCWGLMGLPFLIYYIIHNVERRIYTYVDRVMWWGLRSLNWGVRNDDINRHLWMTCAFFNILPRQRSRCEEGIRY